MPMLIYLRPVLTSVKVLRAAVRTVLWRAAVLTVPWRAACIVTPLIAKLNPLHIIQDGSRRQELLSFALVNSACQHS